MNLTVQVKKYRKLFEEMFLDRAKDRELLETINNKLDIILDTLKKLEFKRENVVKTPFGTIDLNEMEGEMKKESEVAEELYVPEVDIDGMQVIAKTKAIEEGCKDIKGKIDKLNKLSKKKKLVNKKLVNKKSVKSGDKK